MTKLFSIRGGSFQSAAEEMRSGGLEMAFPCPGASRRSDIFGIFNAGSLEDWGITRITGKSLRVKIARYANVHH